MAVDPNIKFLVYLKSLGGDVGDYRVLYMRVSALTGGFISRDKLSRALSQLAGLKANSRGSEIFLMRNADIVFIGKGVNEAILTEVGAAVEKMYLQAPTSGGDKKEKKEPVVFFTIYDLDRDLPTVMEWTEEMAGLSKAQIGGDVQKKEDIDAASLSELKENLQKIDISSILFNQPAYEIEAAPPKVVFQEMYISMRMLEEVLCPGLSLTSKRWLFNDLTEDLDAVVLRFLADPIGVHKVKCMSINVNLSTLASEKFATFDAEISSSRRSGIILEINKTDMFENMRLFNELTPYLRERGYRILLDGLSFLNLAAIDFRGVNCDFVKLMWSPQVSSLDEDTAKNIADKLRAKERHKFILAHCDSAESMRFARTMGFSMAQGRLIDHMVRRGVPI